MKPPSLRARLTLAFLALVSLILFVGAAAYLANNRVRSHVAGLRAGRVFDLRRIDLQAVGLEVEGYWSPSGSFIATDIELDSRLQRPRLRGRIQGVDAEERRIVLFGVPVHVPENVELVGSEGEKFRFEDLSAEQRVEVTCTIQEERWEATKIRLRDLKSSDKIKGTATAVDLDGAAPDAVEIHGLRIVVEATGDGDSRGPVGQIEKSTRMILAVQECRAAAHDLVSSALGSARVAESGESPSARLSLAATDFRQLANPTGAPGSDARGLVARAEQELDWLLPISRHSPTLDEHVERLCRLARDDPPKAETFLHERLEPFLETELLPLVHASLSQGEEDLGDELRQVQEGAASTARIALVTGAVAVIVAIVLGFLLWRSISAPLGTLRAAALRIGQGNFDTRLELAASDEFVVLADGFNRMAAQLSTTTVSIANLEGVFDSMAAALILFDPQGRITNVNRAAQTLLGYERGELLGLPFGRICRNANGGPIAPSEVGPRARTDGAAPDERIFVRKDGAEFAVAFSAAALRSEDGPLRGYVCVAQDLSAQKRIEDQVRGSLAEKELLLREVHHRVKNNMQVISSLLAMQSSETSDAGTLDKLAQSQNRIRSMALIHDQLHRSTHLANIDVRQYLQLLTEHLRRSFGQGEAVEVKLRVEDLPLDMDQSLACGLIVTELMTNSLKHAFRGRERGIVRVSLTRNGDDACLLSVSDDGAGNRAPDVDRATTLGLSLVRTLARQLRGRIEVESKGGAVVRIHFPLRAAQGSAVS